MRSGGGLISRLPLLFLLDNEIYPDQCIGCLGTWMEVLYDLVPIF